MSSSQSAGPSGAKRARPDSGSEQQSKAKLPGTAQGQGAGELVGGPRSEPLPRPTIQIHLNLKKFTKVHRFLTWGIAYDILLKTEDVEPKEDWLWMTTPLAHVPWDRPYFYITPAEYNALPRGSSVKHCSVKVIPRNVRIAFPTNSTTSNLATLNQNKDLIVGKGLQINCHTVNAHYTTFQDNQPMIPSDFELEKLGHHQDLSKDLYGIPGQKVTAPVPRHQMGIPTPLPNYAVIPKSAVSAEADDYGWPCLQHFYTDFDADCTTGNMICEMEYAPTVGLIKDPIKTHYDGYKITNDSSKISANNKLEIPRGSHTLNRHVQTFTFPSAPGEATLQSENISGMQVPTHTAVDYYFGLIEKSQKMQFGNFQSQNVNVQPTLHIGIQPVQALTTASLQGQSNSSFTDSSAYFEIIAEMVVEESYPTPYPLASEIHVTEHGQVWEGVGNLRVDRSTFNGLYQME